MSSVGVEGISQPVALISKIATVFKGFMIIVQGLAVSIGRLRLV